MLRNQLVPNEVDLFHNFLPWFRQGFPCTEQVVVFGKNNTLLSWTPQGREKHEHLLDEVVYPLALRKPSYCLALISLSERELLERDVVLFPETFWLFDVILTLENLHQAPGANTPAPQEKERLLKSVEQIFNGYPVVLVDEWVGTVWCPVQPGLNGVKPYALHEDSPHTAREVLRQIDHCLAAQTKRIG